MRGRLLVLVLGIVVVLPVPVRVVTYLFRPGTQITRENYEKIRPGLSEWDVVQLFCVQPGYYARPGTNFLKPVRHGPFIQPLREPLATKTWTGDWGKVEVSFDGNGRIVTTRFHDPFPREQSLLDLVRRRIGL